MDEKITIIEGPPPTFESIDDGWALSLNESNLLYNVSLTRLRTYNGQSLLERCHRAWRHHQPIHLEYRDSSGLENKSQILAARTLEIDEGQVLFLWVRQELDVNALESEFDGSEDDPEDDEDFTDGLDFPDI